jgi:hypothetical protein
MLVEKEKTSHPYNDSWPPERKEQNFRIKIYLSPSFFVAALFISV